MSKINNPTISSNSGLRPSYIHVNLDHITENFNAIKKQVGDTIVMPIIKANAYGHGIEVIGKHMEKFGAHSLGVAFVEEAILLREAGIKLPILVFGGILGDQIPIYLENDLTLTASSIEKLEQIDSTAEQMNVIAKVHLKIDTGMERIGIHYYSAEALLEASLKCNNLVVEGVFSHFANADTADLSHAKLQLERFNEVLSFYENRNLPFPIRHIANSAAILQMPESYFDMVRPGIMLYGVYPSNEVKKTIEIKPALTWKSRVVFFKVVKPNHPVSYGSEWQSDKMTRVVTIPVGFGDGYFRSMTGNASVLINGKKYPVIGRICMDQFMVNIYWDSAYNGDEVTLVGGNEEAISVEDLADWAGTTPYEILTNINTRVPRLHE